MTDIELLPCPFCGGKASMRHNYHWWVECVSCGADTPDSAPMDEDGAAAAWNTRANVAYATAPLQAEIEALQEDRDGWRRQAQYEADVATMFEDRADRLAEALRELVVDMERAQANMRNAAKTDPRWEGCAEAIQPRVDAARAALRDHDQGARGESYET